MRKVENLCSKINLAYFSIATDVLGPGRRACIWVQGCQRRCPGCINPGMLPFVEKRLVEPQDLALRVLDLMPLEGVTLGGGEPFLQASALAEFVETLKAASNLSCLTYSGYTLDEIRQSKEKGWRKLLSLTDILIDGEYIEDLPSDDLLWRGSSNQNIHLLASRYKGLKETDFKKKAGDLEFHLTQDGELVMIGVPQRGFFRRFKEKLSEQGIMLEEEYPS